MKKDDLIWLLIFLITVLGIITLFLIVSIFENNRQESCLEETGKPCPIIETMVDREIREFSECSRDPECNPYGLP